MNTRNKPLDGATTAATTINNYYTTNISGGWVNVNSLFTADDETIVNNENVGITVDNLLLNLHCLFVQNNIGDYDITGRIDVVIQNNIFQLKTPDNNSIYLKFNNNNELVIYTSRP